MYIENASAPLLLPIPFFLRIQFLSPFLPLPKSQIWDALLLSLIRTTREGNNLSFQGLLCQGPNLQTTPR